MAAIDKLQAARRQLDSAIRLFLAGEDSLTVHNAAYDGYSVLRDLFGEGSNIKKALVRFENRMKLRHVPEWLKHAENDPDDILKEHSRESVHLLITLGIRAWKEHGREPTQQMIAFTKLRSP